MRLSPRCYTWIQLSYSQPPEILIGRDCYRWMCHGLRDDVGGQGSGCTLLCDGWQACIGDHP